MREIIIWNDFCLEDDYDEIFDIQMRNLFNGKFDVCDSIYLGYDETRKWSEYVSQIPGIALGKRPIKFCKENYLVQMSRVFDGDRHVCGYQLDEEQLQEYEKNGIHKNKIIIHEDAIVEGYSIIYLLECIKKNGFLKDDTQVEIYAFSVVESGVEKICENHKNVSVHAAYRLTGNRKNKWDSTILFLSDILERNSQGKMFLEDKHRFRQCFYSKYEEILEKCQNISNI